MRACYLRTAGGLAHCSHTWKTNSKVFQTKVHRIINKTGNVLIQETLWRVSEWRVITSYTHTTLNWTLRICPRKRRRGQNEGKVFEPLSPVAGYLKFSRRSLVPPNKYLDSTLRKVNFLFFFFFFAHLTTLYVLQN